MSNPDITKHTFRVLAYNEDGLVIRNYTIPDVTKDEAEAQAKERSQREDWSSYVVEHVRHT